MNFDSEQVPTPVGLGKIQGRLSRSDTDLDEQWGQRQWLVSVKSPDRQNLLQRSVFRNRETPSPGVKAAGAIDWRPGPLRHYL